jgi:AcrR family transcriptional regulator
MPKIRTYSPDDRLVAERREQIVRSAVRLMAKKGFNSTGVREIARACNMTIGNLYHYIGKKEDIIFLILEYGLELNRLFVEHTTEDMEKYGALEAFIRAIGRYIRHVDSTAEFTDMLYKELRSFKPCNRKAVMESEMAIIGAFENILRRGCEDGVFEVADIRLAAGNIVSLAEMWSVKRWQFRGRYSVDEYIRLNTEMILKQVGINSAGVKN